MSTVELAMGTLIINGEPVVFGDGWVPATSNNTTPGQAGAFALGIAQLKNSASGYVALTVERAAGDIDVYTISPSGRDIRYVTTVTWYGHKVQR